MDGDPATRQAAVMMPRRLRGLVVLASAAGLLVAGSAVAADRTRVNGTPEADHLVGTESADAILGRAGDDRAEGRGGDDLLVGGPGVDRMHGGEGDDRLLEGSRIPYNSFPSSLFGNEGDDYIDLRPWGYYGSGGPGADTVVGGRFQNYLVGMQGPDILSGGGRGDQVFGGRGTDQLRGGAENDTIGGGRATDELRGGRGADQLDGHRGADTLWAGRGDDRVYVREDGASDSIHCGPGRDVVTFEGTLEDVDHYTDCEVFEPFV